ETLTPTIEQAFAHSDGPGINHVGAYVHSASSFLVYCLELGLLPDMGNSDPALDGTSTIPAYQAAFINQGGNVFNGVGAGAISPSSRQYKRISFILGKYGQTQNSQQAAAVALAIWEIRGEVGKTGDYDALLNYYKAEAGGGATSQAAS